ASRAAPASGFVAQRTQKPRFRHNPSQIAPECDSRVQTLPPVAGIRVDRAPKPDALVPAAPLYAQSVTPARSPSRREFLFRPSALKAGRPKNAAGQAVLLLLDQDGGTVGSITEHLVERQLDVRAAVRFPHTQHLTAGDDLRVGELLALVLSALDRHFRAVDESDEPDCRLLEPLPAVDRNLQHVAGVFQPHRQIQRRTAHRLADFALARADDALGAVDDQLRREDPRGAPALCIGALMI